MAIFKKNVNVSRPKPQHENTKQLFGTNLGNLIESEQVLQTDASLYQILDCSGFKIGLGINIISWQKK